MQLTHSFTVPVSVPQAWDVLLDIERIAPCMPGATLTAHSGDAFEGTVRVKVGPVSLTYRGKGRFVERDDAAHRVVISASGSDARGAGTAAAKVSASLAPDGDGTRVDVVTDLDITGRAAQFGRGLIADVSGKLVRQFADCVAGKLAESAVPAGASGATAADPVAPPTAAVPAAEPELGEAPAGQDATDDNVAPPPGHPGVVETRPGVAEPIDLLQVSGAGAAMRRAVPYLVAAVVGFVLVFGLLWLFAD